MMREVALMGLFLGVPQTSARLNVSPLVILGWIKNLGYDPLFRDIISTLMEGVTGSGVDRIAHEFRLSQDTLRRIIAFAKREIQEADKKIEDAEKLENGMDLEGYWHGGNTRLGSRCASFSTGQLPVWSAVLEQAT